MTFISTGLANQPCPIFQPQFVWHLFEEENNLIQRSIWIKLKWSQNKTLKFSQEQNTIWMGCPSRSSKSSNTSSLLPRTKFHYVNVNWPFEWAGHSWCFAQIPFRFTVAQSKLLLSLSTILLFSLTLEMHLRGGGR